MILCRTYTGRGPLEAASMGINLGPNDIAYRCNLVTIGEKDSANAFMDDFTAGHISTEEAREIILDINKETWFVSISILPGRRLSSFMCLAQCFFISGNNCAS